MPDPAQESGFIRFSAGTRIGQRGACKRIVSARDEIADLRKPQLPTRRRRQGAVRQDAGPENGTHGSSRLRKRGCACHRVSIEP